MPPPIELKHMLRQSHLGAGLDEKELQSLAAIAQPRRLGQGAMLFLEGDRAAGFFVLLSGRLRIYKAAPGGREYTIHQISPGQMFAEVAIFHGERFPANCAALDDSLVAFFPKDRFIGLIRESPQISLKIIGSLSAFLRDYNRQIENLSLREVPARLASFLLGESLRQQRQIVTLDCSKKELARRLGTISETLSRSLRKLRELRLIEVVGDRITILDSGELSRIAEGE